MSSMLLALRFSELCSAWSAGAVVVSSSGCTSAHLAFQTVFSVVIADCDDSFGEDVCVFRPD